MSEVQSRPANVRGRGGFRGGRGGYRGSRGGTKVHVKSEEHDLAPSTEDQGEVGELKAKYGQKLPLLREVCEGWSDEDLVFALQETDGDVDAALDRITSGNISKWSEVTKKQAKAKDALNVATDSNSRGRGRGGLEGRGRGRGADRTDRGGRAGRGARAPSQANGTKASDKPTKIPDEPAVDPTPTNGEAVAAVGDWENDAAKENTAKEGTAPVEVESQRSTVAAAVPAANKAGGWASLFAKPPPTVAAKKPSIPQLVAESEPAASAIPETKAEEATPSVTTDDTPADFPVPPPIVSIPIDETTSELPSAPHSDIAANELTPPQDQLTELNLDKLPDMSNPPATATAASTVASTQDGTNPALPPISAIRPGMSGHAASALRATSNAGRSASYSRKILEQQEAVVMPGHQAVEKAAVQFGKMGLDEDDVDADEDREEPETRTQLPDDSPTAPRASLPPPVPEAQKTPVAATAVAETPTETVAQRAAPGLPPAPQQVQQVQQVQQAQQAQQAQQTSPPQTSAFPDQYRYGQGQKPYDPFSQQPQQSQAPTEPFSNQLPGQSHALPGSGQHDYSQYYNRDYQYYGGYGQGPDPQRSGSAFGTSGQDSAALHATAGPRGYSQQEATNSGHNTPQPATGGQQGQASQQHMQQGPGAHGGYPYGAYGNNYGQAYPQYGQYNQMGAHRYGAARPMFDDARRQEDFYNSQYGYGHNQQYGNNYKSNMYGGPQQQQQQYSHDYSSSANTGYSGRDHSYGRASSTQPSDMQQSATPGSNTFGSSMQDAFARTPSGFGQSQHGSHSGSEDPAKPTGPSPSLQGNRPGSAVNNLQGQHGQQQGGLPHAQSGQQSFGGYPQYAGFGNQNSHNSGYGAYGSSSAFGGGYAAYNRNWSGNYGNQH